MEALVYQGPEQITLEELDIPVPAADEVLVEVRSVGICGSELEGFMGHSSIRVAPLVMGHEFCGHIVKLGAKVKSLSIGSKVVVNPLIACGSCDRCLAGKQNVCRSRRIIGIHRPGAFARFVTAPAANVLPVPEELDSSLASLAEPLAVSIHAVKLGVQPLEEVLIFGAGPIGLLTLQAARHMGAGRITLVDLQASRLEHAAKLGAAVVHPGELESRWSELFPRGIDVIIDCVGVQPTREQAMRLVNPGGRIIMVGLGQQVSSLPVNDLVRQEIALLGSYTYSDQDFRQALELIQAGRITAEGWTRSRKLSEGPAAFRELVDGKADVSKIFLVP